jgi:uncharacterized protein (TIGR02266 family)
MVAKKDGEHEDSLEVAERRVFRRATVDYDLKVDVGTGHDFYTGLLEDISTGGIFIATDKEHRIGDRIEVRFAFPGLPHEVEARGVVRWQRSEFADRSQREGYGIQLEDLPLEITQAINAHLKRNSSLVYSELTDEYEEW